MIQRASGSKRGPAGTGCAVVAAALLTGCLGMPAQMRIETASDPKYEDKDVRFRTTYYFRVFDYCADDGGTKRPRNDTLYRFRMTGKANSLTTQVHFESGTLTATQIDPFGASVVYDERNKQHYFKSQGEALQEGQRERKFDDLKRLMQVSADAAAVAASAPKAASAAHDKLQEKLVEVIEQRVLSLKDPQADVVPPGSKPASGAESKADTVCQKTQRGFQILGPEGWRTFNQDERLLLAMSSSGRPLISTMQEISGRVLNSQPVEAEMLLPLVREDLRISRAERELDKFTGSNPDRVAELLAQAIRQLAAKEGAP